MNKSVFRQTSCKIMPITETDSETASNIENKPQCILLNKWLYFTFSRILGINRSFASIVWNCTKSYIQNTHNKKNIQHNLFIHNPFGGYWYVSSTVFVINRSRFPLHGIAQRIMQGCRKCPIARTRFGRTFDRSGEIFINNLKTENKWTFLLTGGNFHKHQNK